MRLSKYLSQKGICSRREAELFIQNGWLQVDGNVVCEPGTQVDDNCQVVVDPQAQEYQKQLLTILLNKPIGYVSSQPEKNYKPAVSLIKRQTQYQSQELPNTRTINWPINGLAPAGRLDIDSSGLLVFTQDGRIARKLIASDSQIEKEYLVRVDKPMYASQIKRLSHGLKLDDIILQKAIVEPLDKKYFRMILTEGRKRQIRRMCAMVGLEVVGLKRVRIGNVRLGPLRSGKWRLLGTDENF